MKALNRRIIVEPIARPSMHAGVHLVEWHHPPSTARVVSAADAVCEEWPDIAAGQEVCIKPMGGRDIEFRGRKLKLMETDEVLAIMERPDASQET